MNQLESPAPAGSSSRESRPLAILRLLRPHHWTKNLLCFAGVVFSGRFRDPRSWGNALDAFLVFCAASSAVYVLNDILDRARDLRHPVKCRRPIASGAVSVAAGAFLSLLLGAGSLGLAAWAGPRLLTCAAALLGVHLLYSLWLKHVPLLDVLCIAAGFVLRMLAGVYAVGEIPTVWITLCTFFLALFLALAKRRAELGALGGTPSEQRPVLTQYTIAFLDHAVTGAAVVTILCYALFTATSGKNPAEIVTVPVVVYGILHYLRRVLAQQGGEEPELILLKDLRISASVLLWVALYVAIQILDPRLFARSAGAGP